MTEPLKPVPIEVNTENGPLDGPRIHTMSHIFNVLSQTGPFPTRPHLVSVLIKQRIYSRTLNGSFLSEGPYGFIAHMIL